jgi:hypothetical protein
MTRICVAILIVLFAAAPAGAQSDLVLVEDVELGPLREHCRQLLQAPLPAETKCALQALLQEAKDGPSLAAEVQKLLDPHCLIGITINPESRVKAARGPAPAGLRLGRENFVLIKVHNDAGVTHALRVDGPHLRSAERAEEGRWLEAATHVSPPLGKTLTGGRLEYVLLRLTPHEAGKREATLRFDVGQGTQDLGFRAEVAVLFLVKKE